MTTTTWAPYLANLTDGARHVEIANRIGLQQSTVSRWLRGEVDPEAKMVVRVAEAYGANVLEALVAAGILTPDQAGATPPDKPTDFRSIVQADPALSQLAKAHLIQRYELLVSR